MPINNAKTDGYHAPGVEKAFRLLAMLEVEVAKVQARIGVIPQTAYRQIADGLPVWRLHAGAAMRTNWRVH